jgi:hypothetical protein
VSQGEQYYENASKQIPTARDNATAGISAITGHIRNLSVQNTGAASTSTAKDGTTSETKEPPSPEAHPDRPESLPADIVKEAEGMLARFRSEAAKRLKDIEKAEDAADEALLKFGTNIKNFLSDAVTIEPSATNPSDPSKVLFESKDSEGKRVIHTTRFDAQLHVIHSTLDSFLKDPTAPQWEQWKKDFDIEKKTADIAKDLERHTELRTAMEKLVPEKVEYADFWRRYYFLRHVIESEEQRRREMLKGVLHCLHFYSDFTNKSCVASAPADEEEVGWDEDSDDDSPTPSKSTTANLAASKETLKPASTPDNANLKPDQPRRSNDEKSVADSDASYDLVSGATSRAPGSPQDKKKAAAEESDEEDWE